MKKSILFLSSLLALGSMTANAQVYRDGFTNDYAAPIPQRWGDAPAGTTITHVAKSNVVTFVGNGTTGKYASITYDPYDNPQMNGIGSYDGTTGAQLNFDMSDDLNIYVVARATKSTKVTLQLKDAANFVTNAGATYEQTVGTTSSVITYNYTGAVDAGYGGSVGCTETNPCDVDFTSIAEFLFIIEASTGGFDGTLIIDYIQVGGTKPVLPTVSITSPANGAKIAPTPTPSLTATVAASTGSSVDSIVYYDGTGKIATAKTTPYSAIWASPSLGAHVLTAVVFDKSGIINSSAANAVTVATATSISSANIASSNLYPNPATNVAHIELNLATASDVKIMVTDAVGKQIANISQGVTSSVSYDLNVAGLTKGVYTVTYVLDGTPAKASLLVVQ